MNYPDMIYPAIAYRETRYGESYWTKQSNWGARHFALVFCHDHDTCCIGSYKDPMRSFEEESYWIKYENILTFQDAKSTLEKAEIISNDPLQLLGKHQSWQFLFCEQAPQKFLCYPMNQETNTCVLLDLNNSTISVYP